MAYRIRTVSEMTGIPRNTLIAWERRYGLVQPRRQDNSYRSYSEEDVEKLLRIKRAMNSGLSISESIELLRDGAVHDSISKDTRSGDAGAPVVLRSVSGTGASDPPERRDVHYEAIRIGPAEETFASAHPFESICSRLLAALTEFREADAESILSELLVVGCETRIHQVFFPVLRRIGDLWQQGRVTVAQEHYAAAVVRHQMVTMLLNLGTRSDAQQAAACTTFPEDLHELGALAMSLRLTQAGYRVTYLGPNLSAVELGKFCQSKAPNLLCVSALLRQSGHAVLAYARELRRAVPHGVRIVIGGRGVDIDPMPHLNEAEVIPHWKDFSALPS